MQILITFGIKLYSYDALVDINLSDDVNQLSDELGETFEAPN